MHLLTAPENRCPSAQPAALCYRRDEYGSSVRLETRSQAGRSRLSVCLLRANNLNCIHGLPPNRSKGVAAKKCASLDSYGATPSTQSPVVTNRRSPTG